MNTHKGASTAIMLILNIAASLIAFKSFIAFLDGAVAWFGMHAGADINFQVAFLLLNARKLTIQF